MGGKPVKTITGLNKPYGVAVCDNGDIVVTEWGAHCVTILNKEGKKVNSFSVARGTKEEQFNYLGGVTISSDGHILVTGKHRLQKLTFDGDCVQSVGNSESGSGQLQFNNPRGIAVHPTTGLVFVADGNNNRIQVFNHELNFVCTIILNDCKQFNYPCDVSFDSDGCMYVVEYGNNCITKLTTTGEFIKRFGSYGSAPGQLNHPSSLTINNNLIYVSEEVEDCLSIFDEEGTFLHCFGKKGSGEGEFKGPHGITTDTFGNLYVCDSYNNRIVVF